MSAHGGAPAVHQPNPLTYRCQGCADPWPCRPARRHLLTTHGGRGELGNVMAAEMVKAMDVLGDGPLYQRFLGWIRTSRAEMRR